jgi:hypothetical protein
MDVIREGELFLRCKWCVLHLKQGAAEDVGEMKKSGGFGVRKKKARARGVGGFSLSLSSLWWCGPGTFCFCGCVCIFAIFSLLVWVMSVAADKTKTLARAGAAQIPASLSPREEGGCRRLGPRRIETKKNPLSLEEQRWLCV